VSTVVAMPWLCLSDASYVDVSEWENILYAFPLGAQHAARTWTSFSCDVNSVVEHYASVHYSKECGK
jgi:hypothetical protein